jgi:hypothetical protein
MQFNASARVEVLEDPSKHQETQIQQHNIVSQKIWYLKISQLEEEMTIQVISGTGRKFTHHKNLKCVVEQLKCVTLRSIKLTCGNLQHYKDKQSVLWDSDRQLDCMSVYDSADSNSHDCFRGAQSSLTSLYSINLSIMEV